MRTVLFYMAAWLGLAVLAILNGTVREKGYGRRMPELAAHQLSTAFGIVLFGVYTWVLTGVRPIETPGLALGIGAAWLAMTVAFEVVMGRFVMGHPWRRLLADYHLHRGRVWVLLLVWIAVSPYLFQRLRP